MADLLVALTMGTTTLSTSQPIVLIPGSMLQGVVVVQTVGGVKCRAISLRAQWRTNGRGDTDSGNAFNLTLYQGQVPPGGYSLPFQTQVPLAPWSYNGHYISIVWNLVVECDLGMFNKPKFLFPFLLRAL